MWKKSLGRNSGSGVVFISLITFGHTSLQLKGNLREWECLFYLTFIYFYVPQTDENKVDGVSAPKGQSGSSSRGPGDGGNKDHWKEADRKDGKKDHNSRSAPEPKKAEENPASKFSSASKYAALAIDGEDENEGDYTE